jgi:uncharacterized protein YjbI with pentapeptide repeats
MSKLAVLKFGKYSQETGVAVTLQIAEEGTIPFLEHTGRLPPAPELHKIYEYLWSIYPTFGVNLRGIRPIGRTQFSSREDFNELANKFKISLNDWLSSQQFRSLKDALLRTLDPSEEIRVLILAEDIELQKIPWHLWDFFDYYRKAEVALGSLTYGKVERLNLSTPKEQVRILAILGNSDGINLQKDWELLQHLPDAEIFFLVEPSHWELDRKLWDERGWDILFFAGHSSGQVDGEKGYISINKTDILTVNDLRNALKASIERGLQIAIFNSCDGLGLAQNLADLHIPQVVFMREPVPDLVAHEFLKHFLKTFSSGQSLYISLREARERLQGLESDFPCASWLPVLFQNPAELPPTWWDLCPISFMTQQRAKNEYLTLSQKRVEAWNKWRSRNYDLVPDLRKINLIGVNLSGANLSKVNLSGVNLSGANLCDTNLSEANLTNANLKAVQALNANFEKALLTGACIQDLNINSDTNLNGVICSYIYLRDSQQERRPSIGNLATGEFTKLFKKALETVDLIFQNGIDWDAFTYSFKKLEVENQDAQLDVQSIEKKGDGVLVVRVSVSSNAYKTDILSDFMQGYQFAHKALEAQYQARLEDKDKEINKLFYFVSHLQEQLSEVPKLISKGSIGRVMNFYGSIGGSVVSGDNIGTGVEVKGNVNTSINNSASEKKQTLAEAAAEIQQLLNQLSIINPTSTKAEELAVVAQAVEKIESNPILKARVIGALKSGATEALKELVNHPLTYILFSALEGWLDNE